MSVAETKPQRAESASDAELIGRAGRGDRRALAALYDRHAAKAHGLALRLSRSAQEAEDIVQEVFLEIWREAARFDAARGTVLSWIYVKTRSRTLDRLRRLGVRRAELVSDPAAARALFEVSAHPEPRLAVRQALAELPIEVQDVLLHTFFLGSTGRETSEALGIPEGTVRSRLARGLAAIEARLNGGEVP